MLSKKQTGFTIVELLIVIVVIGILAAITIVAYSGVQQKAVNTQTTTAAKDAIKLLMAYKAEHDAYPSGGYSYACIGEYAGDTCQYLSTGVAEVSEQAAFKTAIATLGTMPQPSERMFGLAGTRTGGGAFYRVTQKDVTYRLSGANQVCAVGAASNSIETTQCIYTLP